MKGIFKEKIIPGVLTLSLVLECAFFLFITSTPKKAEAIVSVPITGILELSPTAVKRTTDSTMQQVKDFVLNGLVNALAQSMINNITADMVDWINNGFEGGPAFLSDPEGFFLNSIDETLGEFVLGTDLGFLCSPFSLDVRLAIGYSYQGFRRKAACTMSQIINNVQNAGVNLEFQGNTNYNVQYYTSYDNFSRAFEPQNTAIGAYMAAQAELSERQTSIQQSKQRELALGSGFLSFKKCVAYEDTEVAAREAEAEGADPNAAVTPKCIKYETTTPGSVVQSQLNQTLQGPFNKLQLADQINEIIGALMNYAVRQVIGGVGGLLGASSNSSSSSSGYSYTQTMRSLVNMESQEENIVNSNSSYTSIASGQVSSLNQEGSTGQTTTTDSNNLAINAQTSLSSTLSGHSGSIAVDGNYSDENYASTNFDYSPWIQIDLGSSKSIGEVDVWRRNDSGTNATDSVGRIRIFVSDENYGTAFNTSNIPSGVYATDDITVTNSSTIPITVDIGRYGRYVRIQRVDNDGVAHKLQIEEIKVYKPGYSYSSSSSYVSVINSSGTTSTTSSVPVSMTPQVSVQASVTNGSYLRETFNLKVNQDITGYVKKLYLYRAQADGTFTGIPFSSVFSSFSISTSNNNTGESGSFDIFRTENGSCVYCTLSAVVYNANFYAQSGSKFTTNYQGVINRYVQYGNYRLETIISTASGSEISAQVSNFTVTDIISN